VGVAGVETSKIDKVKICWNILELLSCASNLKEKIIRTKQAPRESIYN
jgi:hypothetical protein